MDPKATIISPYFKRSMATCDAQINNTCYSILCTYTETHTYKNECIGHHTDGINLYTGCCTLVSQFECLLRWDRQTDGQTPEWCFTLTHMDTTSIIMFTSTKLQSKTIVNYIGSGN